MVNKKGAILLTVIVVLVFLAVMGMSLLGLLFSRTTLTSLAIDRLKAFYLAEAGVASAINELRTELDSDGNGIGNVAVVKLGDGVFSAQHNPQTFIITAFGEVNKTRRTVQIKYAVF